MKKQYQVTLLCVTNKYKPLSTIVNFEQIGNFDLTPNLEYKKQIIQQGTEKICNKRGLTGKDLQKMNFLKVRVRAYDKEKIEKEAAARYDEIKREKFASGEWKPSAKDKEKGLTN